MWQIERFGFDLSFRPPLSLTLDDALEATRIGLAITRSLHSGMPEGV